MSRSGGFDLTALLPKCVQVIADIKFGAVAIVIVSIVSGAKPKFNESPDGPDNRNELN